MTLHPFKFERWRKCFCILFKSTVFKYWISILVAWRRLSEEVQTKGEVVLVCVVPWPRVIPFGGGPLTPSRALLRVFSPSLASDACLGQSNDIFLTEGQKGTVQWMRSSSMSFGQGPVGWPLHLPPPSPPPPTTGIFFVLPLHSYDAENVQLTSLQYEKRLNNPSALVKIRTCHLLILTRKARYHWNKLKSTTEVNKTKYIVRTGSSVSLM